MVDSDAGVSTFVEVDDEGRYIDAPPEALAVFGVTLDELRRRRVGDFAPSGLGPIHRALFLWVARQGEDFGGGRSTIVSPDGRATPVECTRIERRGDRYRISLTIGTAKSDAPHTDAIAAVLEAWRQAERQIAAGESSPEYELAKSAAEALREVYQTVAKEKAGTTPPG